MDHPGDDDRSAPDARQTAGRAVLQGVRDLVPIALGMAPFGLVFGITAVESGLPPWGASVYSAVVFAGASQLAAIELLGRDAPAWVAIGTIAIINARMLMYSASLSPRFAGEPLRRRAAMAYLLTDQIYAVTVVKLDAEPGYGPRWAYFVGGGGFLWAAWQAYTLLGATAGAVIPAGVPLAFAIPLVFAALLVPAVADRPTLVAAVVSGVAAVVAGGLPANLGLLVGAGCGIAAGAATSARLARRTAAGRAT